MMRTYLLATSGLFAACAAQPAFAQFQSLPATTDVSTLLSVMRQNADIARPESGGTKAITLAPGDLTPGTGGSVTDASGNVFTLPFKGSLWGNSMGQPMENGIPISDGTGWVIAIRIVNGVACFENAKGLGWGCQGSGTWVSDPGPGASSSAAPTSPSASGAAAPAMTEVTGGFPRVTPGQGAISSNGQAWSVSTDGHAMVNDMQIPGGGGTAAIEVINGVVWGLDDGKGSSPCSGCWFTLSQDGQAWEPKPGQSPPSDGSATPPPSADPAAQQQTPVACGTQVAGGTFRTVGGRIIGPGGKDWVARGVNVYGTSAGASNPSAITQTLTGLNFVRYIARPLNDPGSYDAFVNAMTARGTVVEFEDHPDGGGGQDSSPPQGIAAESAWYAAMAAHFKGNPYVWFGTFNEPMATPGLSKWQQATYQAIRGTGNNSPIMIEVSGSRPWNLQQALDPSAYAAMTNVVWDVHVYPYQNNYSSDPTSITNNITGMIAAAQKITSADGVMPVIIGESGPSTTGSGLDPNGYATVTGLINAASAGTMGGLAPFTWYPGFDSPNNITDSGGNVTSPYGQMVQLFINTSVTPCSQSELNAQAQQSIKTAQAAVLAQQQQPQQQASPESTPPTDPSMAAANAQTAALIQQADALIQQAQTATAPTDAATQALIDKANANLQAAKAAMSGQ